MMKYNEHIRRLARIEGITQWRICLKIGVSEPTLARWLRQPLPPEKEQRILAAIKELSTEVAE